MRVDSAAWSLLGRCDGASTLQQAWDAALAADPERVPTQDEAIELISTAIEQGFLVCDRWPDLAVTLDEQAHRNLLRRWQQFGPLSMRLPLGDPTPLLRPFDGLGRLLFGPVGTLAWLILAGLALVALTAEWDRLIGHASHWLDSPRYWLLAWPCWLPMKAVHEFAHGLAVRRFGGQVREAGLGLLLLVPAPYVDASDAARFPDPRARALVGAAGILAELALAAVALLSWLRLDDGWARDAAFVTAAIGGASTLLFNANPLVRMDGYHVLTDLAELPNLAARSAAVWRAWIARHLLGVPGVPGPDTAPGETRWLAFHAPLAWCWQMSMGAWMVAWAGGHHRLLGAATALMMASALVLMPMARLLREAGAACTGLRDRLRLRIADSWPQVCWCCSQ
jgi:putative peptide zinc metalloprotease protein